MQDPILLLTETIIPVLRSIPALVATVGDDPEQIVPYVYNYPESTEPLFSVIPRMAVPSILVAHRSTNVAGVRGNGIEHTYSCILRPNGAIGAMFVALRDGVPALIRTAEGEEGLTEAPPTKFKLSQIHFACRQPLVMSLVMQSMQIGDSQFEDYYDAPLVLAERGLDS